MASKGLWANIHAKRARGERMRKKGEKGAPTADQIKRAQGEEVEEKAPVIAGKKMKKLGSNPGSYKRLVQRHLGKSADKKITKSDGNKLIAKGKKSGNTDLVRKGSFIKNVIADSLEEGPLDKSSQPQYGKGISGKDEVKQKKAFDRNKKRYAKDPDNPKSFEPTALDKQIMKKREQGKMKDAPKSQYSEGTLLPRPRATPKPRPSSYKVDKSPEAVKKRLAMFRGISKAREKKNEEVYNENAKGLANKAKESGEPLGDLKKVYKRGLAAYASGHRPGMTQHQWAMARVNSYIKGGKARTVDKDLREYAWFLNFVNEAKGDEIKVGGYQTTHHYMCPSAVKFIQKHAKMDHDEKDLEDIARLSDDVFKIEEEIEKSGKVEKDQIESAQRLTDMVYDIIEDKLGHKKSEASYMDLHMDAIKDPKLARSMKA